MPELPRPLRRHGFFVAPMSREELLVHRREGILTSANAAFAARGYRATTIGQLLADLRLGVGTFYKVFDDKEGCFLAALERACERLGDRVGAAARESEDWAEAGRLAVAALAGWIVEEPDEARLLVVEAQAAGERACARRAEILGEAIDWLGLIRRPPPDDGLAERLEPAMVAGLAYYVEGVLLRPAPIDAGHLAEELTSVLRWAAPGTLPGRREACVRSSA